MPTREPGGFPGHLYVRIAVKDIRYCNGCPMLDNELSRAMCMRNYEFALASITVPTGAKGAVTWWVRAPECLAMDAEIGEEIAL